MMESGRLPLTEGFGQWGLHIVHIHFHFGSQRVDQRSVKTTGEMGEEKKILQT